MGCGWRGPFTLSRLSGGTNNQVFKVMGEGDPLLLKYYFHGSHDERNRLKVEFSFCRYAWDNGIRLVPQPLAKDDAAHIGLYGFIEGAPIVENKILEKDMRQVQDFIIELNKHRRDSRAQELIESSEPCYSIRDHLQCVAWRMEMLKGIDAELAVDQEAKNWINTELGPLWEMVREGVLRQVSAIKLDVDVSVDEQDRCLSQSDIGFHNVLRTPSGDLKFVDFEYAGWDDPAKMVCVFFSAPKVPVSLDYFEPFIKSIASILVYPDEFLKRSRILLPVHFVRWYCILLNIFSKSGTTRRSFALESQSIEQQKIERLNEVKERVNVFMQKYSKVVL